MSVSLVIDGALRIKGLPEDLRKKIALGHQIKNPDYHRLIQKNKRLKYSPHLSEYVRYWKHDPESDVLVVGRGSLDRVRSFLARAGVRAQEDDRRVLRSAVYPGGPVRLRDYQGGVPEIVCGVDQGIARCDTGFGKTVVGLEVARRLGQRTLVIVPKLDLAEQFAGDARKFLGIEPGLIQGDQFSVGEQVTIATSQTLRNRIIEGRLKRDDFGCIIVDECHQFVPEKRRQVVEWFHAKHRYGLTGTARRSDGQGEALNFMFGGIIVDKEMPRKAPTVHCVDYHGHHFGLEYHEIIDEQTTDQHRNDLIGKIVRDHVVRGRKILVLTKRVDHYETIAASLGDIQGVHALSSTDARDERKARMASLRHDPDSYQVLLGTFALLGTGTDIPSLDTLVIAGDLKSDVLTEQSAGRVLRLFEGKPDPCIVDIVDKGNGILRNQARLRRKFYASRGWTIIDQEP